MLFFRVLTLNFGALAAILLTAFGAGRLLTRGLACHSRLERIVITTALGFGVCAIALLALAAVGLLYRTLVVAATIASALVVLTLHRRQIRQLAVEAIRAHPRRYPIVVIVLGTLVTQYWLLTVAVTQYPPILWDSTSYHLVLARTYLDAHHLVAQTGLVFPVVPALNHMLFAWGLAMGPDVLPAMIEHSLMTLAALGVVAWGWRRGSVSLGITAAALWIGHPLVAMLGVSAYVEAAAACYAFLGLYALRVCLDGDARWWMVSAALLAMSAGVKSPGLLLFGLASIAALVPVALGRIPRRTFLSGLGIAVLAGAPWYLVVWAVAGNPLWPTSAAFTHGAWESSARAFWPMWAGSVGNIGVPKTLDNFLWIPIYLVQQPAVFLPDNNRLLLPFLAALPVTWFAGIFNRDVRWWTGWTLAFLALWFASSQQMRFLVIAMPMAALALASTAGWLLTRLPLIRGAMWVGVTMAAVGIGAVPLLGELSVKEWPPVTAASRAQFLRNSVHGYRAAEYVNARVAPGEAVGIINAGWLPYHVTARVVDISGSLLQLLGRPVLRWPDDQGFVAGLEAAGVRWIVIGIEGTQPIVTVPPITATGPFVWPGYQVVYLDRDAAVITRGVRSLLLASRQPE